MIKRIAYISLSLLAALSFMSCSIFFASPAPSPTPYASETADPSATPFPTPEPTSTPVPTFAPIWLMGDDTASADLDGDGSDDTVLIETANALCRVSVINADGTFAAELPCGEFLSAVLCDLDKTDAFIELLISMASDDKQTTIAMRFDGERIACAEPIDGYMISVGSNDITLRTKASILGVWWCDVPYRIGASVFALERTPYTDCARSFFDVAEFNLTARDNIAAAVLNENGVYVDATIARGAKLKVFSSDLTNFVMLYSSDGRYFRLAFEVNSGGLPMFGGKDGAQIFDGIADEE